MSDDLNTLITAIFGSDNYDHTLPVSYFVEMLAAERRRKDEAIAKLGAFAFWFSRFPEFNPHPDRLDMVVADREAAIAFIPARQPEPRT